MLVGARGWGSWRSHSWALTYSHEQTRRKKRQAAPNPSSGSKAYSGDQGRQAGPEGVKNRGMLVLPQLRGKRQENTVFVRLSFKERFAQVRDSLRW